MEGSKNLKDFGAVFVIASILTLLYISYQIVSPFKTALFTSIILAIALYPIYVSLRKKIKNPNNSALILILSLIFLVLVPLIFFTNAMFQETINLYNSASGMDLSAQSEKLKEITHLDVNFERYFKETILKLSQTFISSSSSITGYILGGLLNMFVIFFSLFFLLRDGPVIVKKLNSIIPFKSHIKNKFEKEVVSSIRGLFLGLLIIALIEGILAFIGFYIFGIPTPLVWAFIVMILAMVPLLGPTLIYIPASIYLFAMGDSYNAIFLLIYNIIALGYTDNILRHQVLNKTSKINQLALLVGVFGGIQVIGIPGIILGPLTLSLILAVYRIYEEEYVSKK